MEIIQKIPLLLIFFCIALFAEIFVFCLKRKISDEQYKNLHDRIRTWMVIIAVFYFATISAYTIVMLFAIISYLSFKEFLALFSIKLPIHVTTILLISIVMHYLFVLSDQMLLFSIFLPAIITCLFFSIDRRVCIGLFFTVYLLSYIAYFINFPNGINYLVAFVIIIEMNDVYQYLAGTLFGRTKIVPKISPKKTLEGVIGGVVLTTLTIIAFNIFLPYKIPVYLGIGIGILGFLGDITISYYKRKAGKKDSGNLLAGHGGILDRVDSLLYASPLVFFVMYCC